MNGSWVGIIRWPGTTRACSNQLIGAPLVPMIGRINRVYEVLSRRRPLTLAMIQRLHSELGIPAESLLKRSDRRRAA